jgi:hypothetical protein
MVDYVRLLHDAYGIDSSQPISPLPFRDLATEVKRLLQIVELQKGELRRLRRLLGEGLLQGAFDDPLNSVKDVRR